MKILVLNCGSSSLKYQLIDVDTQSVLTKGLLERIGLEYGQFSYTAHGSKHAAELHIANHTEGLRIVMETLTDRQTGVIGEIGEISAVGHRFAHGGDLFAESVLVTPEVLAKVETLIDLAPLHLPGNIMGVRAMQSVLPTVPQVAVFDTSFNLSIEPKCYLYGIPYEYYKRYGIRRYGFHGTSHRFVAKKGAKLIGRYWKDLKIISCHLGSGASICAIDRGRSVNNSMGMTSLEGLTMGTRCGDIDAGALLYLMDKAGLSPQQLNDVLYKQSGLAGLSGSSPDMRDIWAGRNNGDTRCTIAFDVFAQRCKKYIGAYMAQMNGCDLLVFTGGIGENAWFMRHAILENMNCLGISVDMPLNDSVAGRDALISLPGAKVQTAVVTTDEELAIAIDTYKIVSQQSL